MSHLNKVLIVFSLSLLACGHHRDVRPGTNGVHRISVADEDEALSQRNALSQANHFCKEVYNSIAAIKKEQTKYTGSVSEGTYKAGKAASRVLEGSGGQAWAHGGKKEKNAGQVAMGSSGAINSALGNGYTTQMIFTCIK